MPSPDSFATKRGVVRFADDAIHLEESVGGYLRALHRGYWRSDAWWRRAIFLGYVVAVLIGVGWLAAALWRGQVLYLAAVLGLLAVLWVVDYARGFRSADLIPLDDVTDVAATRGEKGLTRPRIVVTYEDGGATRRRRVNLPSFYAVDGESAYERALAAFESRGFDPR